ncbi:helicase-related protein [Lysinibacillus sp. KU-BSD001]|uniref:helicase-related protein n=1 Tax=Lysinibacillus sp. KU-BSD001 TaxID=3141328 RepID=UPI0036EBCD32
MSTIVERQWLKLLNPNDIDLYPIQFAHSDRLNKYGNDVVYIFDEVGSGKTISSGIMALDYLERNNKNVMVITTNSLARKNEANSYGQFLKDWFQKLPFGYKDYSSKITVVNNHYSKFKTPISVGLLIIDEAHLFLNEDTERYLNLVENIKADKVVFLTATPIKTGKEDLVTYTKIASKILGKKVSRDWIDNLDTFNKAPNQLICSLFDLKLPVSRYFKDTIKALDKENSFKHTARRYETLTWNYNSLDSKNEVLANRIIELYNKSEENRFVVFTRYVKKEAEKIGEYLKSRGFINSNEQIENIPTYYIVTGSNPQELGYFSKLDNLPNVLILTYQIAEQGVNLPGFNHIVNYHISSYPSALEQRYGRIDRIDSVSAEIYNCYLINDAYLDTNTFNFLTAIQTSLYSLLNYLPSRNTILSPRILTEFINRKKFIDDYIEKIRTLLEDNQLMLDLYKKLLLYSEVEAEYDEQDMNEVASIDDEELKELFDFCDEYSIIGVSDLEMSQEAAIEILIKDIKNELALIKRQFVQTSEDKEKVSQLLKKDKGIWDKIFYIKGISSQNLDIGTVDPIKECAIFIKNLDGYSDYLKDFNESIKLPLEFEKYREGFNLYFENLFKNNKFNQIFPSFSGGTYGDQFQGFKTTSPLLYENLEELIRTLPFFKMCNQLKKELIKLSHTEQGYTREKYSGDVHYFATAMGRLAKIDFGLSEDFYKKYFGQVIGKNYYVYKDEFKAFFKVEFTENDNNGKIEYVGEASNWLKLIYTISREQSILCIINKRLYYAGQPCLKRIVDVEKVKYTPNNEEIVKGLFDYIVRTNSGDWRSWVKKGFIDDVPNANYVWSNDYWTKSILKVVRNQSFN